MDAPVRARLRVRAAALPELRRRVEVHCCTPERCCHRTGQSRTSTLRQRPVDREGYIERSLLAVKNRQRTAACMPVSPRLCGEKTAGEGATFACPFPCIGHSRLVHQPDIQGPHGGDALRWNEYKLRGRRDTRRLGPHAPRSRLNPRGWCGRPYGQVPRREVADPARRRARQPGGRSRGSHARSRCETRPAHATAPAARSP